MPLFARQRSPRATAFLAVAAFALAFSGTTARAEDGQVSRASQSASPSAQRKFDFLFVKPDRSPIAQTTKLDQSTIALGVRFLPIGRGRDVSRYAFIPRRVTPYVGAGLNVVAYAFAQRGQFMDFVDLKIFNDAFTSDG